MSDEAPAGQESALNEFTALRAEIIARQNSQQGLLSIQLTAAGALFSLALSGAGRSAVLLILPLITYMLAGRHVSHSYACTNIGAYVRTRLSPRVGDGLGWEQWLVEHRTKASRSRSLNPLFITFPGISVLALLGSLPYLVTLRMSVTAVMLWAGRLAGVGLAWSAARLVWNVRGDSFLRSGPAEVEPMNR
ncbi:hypothetical protein ACTI_24220 [Actinoplanes sp. OR16]|uniref:hypothetical protein n=1 Tax=Actinoplanes sp. OR16 TaxID=946334 RepID=UPI000F6C6BA9|nr:hypothetical protein [Actinoplanes sp. OR16]BBH65737.1 hypothetical protein ACTI_24220 [Actinoplanes sp. OR16]